MHAVFWKSVSYSYRLSEEYILCIQYFGRVYFMHTLFWKSISICIQYSGRVYFMHSVFWKSISYTYTILEKYVSCIHYLEKAYLMHSVFWKSISYAYSILEYNILCIHYYGRVYIMHTLFWKSISYACNILEEYIFNTILPTLSSVSFVWADDKHSLARASMIGVAGNPTTTIPSPFSIQVLFKALEIESKS